MSIRGVDFWFLGLIGFCRVVKEESKTWLFGRVLVCPEEILLAKGESGWTKYLNAVVFFFFFNN